YRYDVLEIKPLNELIHEDKVTIEGQVVYEPSLTFYGRKKSRLSFTVQVENVAIKAVMFNRAFAKKQINADDMITLTGKWDAHRIQITVNSYKKGLNEEQTKIQPSYTLKGNITNKKVQKLIQRTLLTYENELK